MVSAVFLRSLAFAITAKVHCICDCCALLGCFGWGHGKEKSGENISVEN
jgi:hypothetical protein